jgi:hypothetical protein
MPKHVRSSTFSPVVTSKSKSGEKPDSGKYPRPTSSNAKMTGSKATVTSNCAGSKSAPKAACMTQPSVGCSRQKEFDMNAFLFKEKKIAESSAAHKVKEKQAADIAKNVYVVQKSDTRPMRVHRLMNDPLTKLVCLFVNSTISLFDNVSTLLQREDPCIHILHGLLIEQLKQLMVRFVKPEIITKTSDLTQIKFCDKRK